LIVLPEGEEVVEATCGDRDRWLVNVRDGLVSVKPTEAGIASNLNLVATSGAVYAFLLSEQSASGKSEPDAIPDLTVYLEREEAAFTTTSAAGNAGSSTRPKFVSADQIDDFRQQADLAREQSARATAQARADLEAGITAYRTTYPLSMRFPYRIDTRKGPFRIRAMWHDDHRTFIQTTASELPALYEYADRLPALVNFEVHDGTYVVPRVLRDGYFQLGAARLGFRIQEGK
jgi:type IV secretion system protein VirB9